MWSGNGLSGVVMQVVSASPGQDCRSVRVVVGVIVAGVLVCMRWPLASWTVLLLQLLLLLLLLTDFLVSTGGALVVKVVVVVLTVVGGRRVVVVVVLVVVLVVLVLLLLLLACGLDAACGLYCELYCCEVFSAL